MRLLVGLGNDTDFAHYPLRIDLTGHPVLAGPFGHWPALNTLLVGIGNLIILAIVRDGVLGPGLTDDLQHLFVDIAVMLVNRRAVHGRAGGVVLLPQHVDPPILVAARE